MCKNVIKMRENGAVVGYCYGSKFETSKAKVLEGNSDVETPIIDKAISILYELEELEYSFDSLKKVAPLLIKAYSVLYIAETTGNVSVKKYRKAKDFLNQIKTLINVSREVAYLDLCGCNEEATEVIKRFKKNRTLENYRRVKVYF